MDLHWSLRVYACLLQQQVVLWDVASLALEVFPSAGHRRNWEAVAARRDLKVKGL